MLTQWRQVETRTHDHGVSVDELWRSIFLTSIPGNSHDVLCLPYSARFGAAASHVNHSRLELHQRTQAKRTRVLVQILEVPCNR